MTPAEIEKLGNSDVLDPSSDYPFDLNGQSPRDGHVVHTYSHQGPLPDAPTLAGYKAVDTSLPMEVLGMAKLEQLHRHKMNEEMVGLERTALTNEARQVARGQWLGFSVLVVVLGVALLFAVLGFENVAMIIAALDVVALVSLFVVGQRVNRRAAPTPQPQEEAAADAEAEEQDKP